MTEYTRIHTKHTHTHTDKQVQLGYEKRSDIGLCFGRKWAGSAGGRRCYCVGWKDEAKQGQREEGGEVNLLQLLRFTILNPGMPVQWECMVYRSLTSVSAVCVRRKWLLMPSSSHLHPTARPCWAQNWMLHHSLSLL